MQQQLERASAPAAALPSADFLSAAVWSTLTRSLRLSERESQIAQCILAGYGKEAMAKRLGISDHTVQTHLERLYRKLGVGSRCQVAVQFFAAYVALAPAPAES